MNTDNTDRKFIEPGELRESLESDQKPVIVDVRSREEFASGHIEGAVNIPVDELGARASKLPSNVAIVTVCVLGGTRSCGAAEQLQKLGHTALPLRGGTRGWQDEARAKEESHDDAKP